MQLFAFDKKNRMIPANQAGKQKDYFCRECGGIVRLRGGIHKKEHFFHLGSHPSCRQSGKSSEHLQVQYFLQKLFSPEECELERQFPEIGRIADVVWEKEKFVFEVQCSGISKEEVESRNRDYKSLGYHVIWILHERRFNRWRVTAAEVFLRNSPYYYTNIDNRGRGEIYDQVDVYHGGVRRTYKKLFGVQLNQVRCNKWTDIKHQEKMELPDVLRSRLQSWSHHFGDDLIDKWTYSDKNVFLSLKEAFQHENSVYKQLVNPFIIFFEQVFHTLFIRPYTLIFRILLEKACR